MELSDRRLTHKSTNAWKEATMDWRHRAACMGEDPELLLVDLPPRIRQRITVADGHWIWGGQVNNKGYGVIWAKYPREPEKPGDKRPAHLVVYESLVRLVPIGFELDHTCSFRLCTFPLCMDEVTHAENQRRIGERQATCRKAGHPRTPENIYRDPTTGRTRCIPCGQEAERSRPPRRRGSR